MFRPLVAAVFGCLLGVSSITVAQTSLSDQENWSAFRGNGTSLTSASKLALEWSDDMNIAWSTDLPGYGQSSPVIWGDRVFVTTMQGEMKDVPTLLSVGLSDGDLQWTREYASTQKVKATDYVTRSAPTPAVDGERCFAFFESGELVATDHDGNPLWQRSLVEEYGAFKGNHGIGSSIAINDQAVFVLVAHEGPSYLLAVNKQTGENIFKTDLEPKVSWSSPVLAGDQVIVSISGSVQSFNAKSGKPIWSVADVKGNTVASATVHEDMVFIGSSERGQNFAIRFDPVGDSDQAEVVWRNDEATSSFGSPLYRDGQVYFVNKQGVAFGVDAKTGETVWKNRLAGSSWASPLGTSEHVYFFSKDGVTDVLTPGETPEVVASNTLTIKDRIYGVAVSDSSLVLRTGTRLFGITPKEETLTREAKDEPLVVADCPVAVTSFGAAVCDGYLYVYGGNKGEAHTYSAEGQNNEFLRVKLDPDADWEKLGEVPRRQGNALVAHRGKIYRIGGFEAKNKLDTDYENIVSTTDFAVYDPQSSKWTDLTPLPEPRSSFDAVVAGDTLYVVGGWALNGEREESKWHGTAWKMDLSAEQHEWKPIAAPAERRANSLAELNGKVYLIGGMGENARPTTTVRVYDPQSDQWIEGPKLPGQPMDGFGSSAFNVGGHLIVSTFGGQVLRLGENGDRWEKIRQLDPGRFFHRLVALDDSRFAILGGTSPGSDKQASVEILDLSDQ